MRIRGIVLAGVAALWVVSLSWADDVTGSNPATRPIGGASGVTTASWLAS